MAESRGSTPERKAYMKAYAEANRERIRGHKKAYAEANPEKVRQSKRAYREANPEKDKEYYVSKKEEVRTKQAAYYEANRDTLRAKMKAYREANFNRIRDRERLTKYGTTPEDIARLRGSQGDKCAICGTSFMLTKMNVDHCHSSGLVRGLLCGECNRGLSCFKDNAKVLRRAIGYLADAEKRRSMESA